MIHKAVSEEAAEEFRQARRKDIAAMAELIASEHLPALVIAEHLDGFLLAERDGNLLACGGVEIYSDCAVLRSIVVAEEGRGQGIGRKLSEMLIDLAVARGASDAYLFTMDAWEFWKHLGFVDVPLDEWREPARECWQYQYVSENRNHEMFAGIHSMWKRI